MQSIDFVSWKTLLTGSETTEHGADTPRFATVHPTNLYPVFALRVTSYVSGALFVTLSFGFEDSDCDLAGGTLLVFSPMLTDGVQPVMVKDSVASTWPLSTVPPRFAAWVQTQDVSGVDFSWSLHVTMRTCK